MSEYTREDTSGLALFARLLAREGKREELVQVLEEAVAPGAEHERNAPVSVDIFVSPSNPDLVLLYEHWPNSEGLAEHRANYQSIPAYGEMHDRLNALLAKPIEVIERATPVVRFTRTAREREEEHA